MCMVGWVPGVHCGGVRTWPSAIQRGCSHVGSSFDQFSSICEGDRRCIFLMSYIWLCSYPNGSSRAGKRGNRIRHLLPMHHPWFSQAISSQEQDFRTKCMEVAREGYRLDGFRIHGLLFVDRGLSHENELTYWPEDCKFQRDYYGRPLDYYSVVVNWNNATPSSDELDICFMRTRRETGANFTKVKANTPLFYPHWLPEHGGVLEMMNGVLGG